MDPDSSLARAPGIASDQRGSVTAEYTVVLCVVALGCAFSLVALGGPLVRTFSAQVSWLLLPIP